LLFLGGKISDSAADCYRRMGLALEGVFQEEILGKTYLNFILMARINYNLDAIY